MEITPQELPMTCDACSALACTRIDWRREDGAHFATVCLTHAIPAYRLAQSQEQNAQLLPGRSDAPTDTPSARPPARTLPRAVDGDTIEQTLPCGCTRRIRLLGIDAPERGHELGAEATVALQEWIDDAGALNIWTDAAHPQHDRYGRMLAWVTSPQSSNASVDQARLGLARFDTRFPEGKYGEAVKAAEVEALAAGRGIWRP